MFCKRGVLKNFAKFTGKHQYQRKMPEACNFTKTETLTQLFSCEFCETFQNTFFYKTPPMAASGNMTLTLRHISRGDRRNTFLKILFEYP